MNIVEKLMKIDKGEFDKKKTKKIKSQMLSEILGEDAVITLETVDPQSVLDMSAGGIDEDGNPIMGKAYDTNALIASAGIIDPPLKDAELLKHLGVTTPAQAAKKLFKGEVNGIAAEVNKMAGFSAEPEEIEDEIKN
jgi:hypothetical protein